MRAVPILVAAGLLGCELYSTTPAAPCPGALVATFALATPPGGGPAGPASTCPFASDPNQVLQSLGFTAALHASPDGGAALCRTAAHALPWVGTFASDHLDVGSLDTGGAIPTCLCALAVSERVAGDVARDGGVPVAFAGSLVDTVSAADPDGGPCGCGLPCQVVYPSLAGPAVGAR